MHNPRGESENQRYERVGKEVARSHELGPLNHQTILVLGGFAAENSDLRASRERLMRDNIIDTFYSRSGFEELVRTDTELQELIQSGNFAMIKLDVRFLKAMNELVSEQHADRMLLFTGRRLEKRLAETVRLGDPRLPAGKQPQRSRPTTRRDIVMRYGDDFSILLWGVNPDQAALATRRVQDLFSVDMALRDCSAGTVPIIASADFAHPSQLRDLPKSDPLEIVKAVVATSIENHRPRKKAQYTEMWSHVQRSLPKTPRPHDDRDTAELFLAHCCPRFLRLAPQLLDPNNSQDRK